MPDSALPITYKYYNLKLKHFANADCTTNTDAGDSAIALPIHQSWELKSKDPDKTADAQAGLSLFCLHILSSTVSCNACHVFCCLYVSRADI